MCNVPTEHSVAGQEMSVEQKKHRKHCRLCIWPGRQDMVWLRLGCESCSLPGTPARKLHKAQSERPSPFLFLHIDRCTCHAREKLQRWQKVSGRDYSCFCDWFPLSFCRQKIGEFLRHRLWALRVWGQWSLQLENTGGGRKSCVLLLSSHLCLYWLFTLTADSSHPMHGLWNISLTMVAGDFQNDLNTQTKYLINSGSFPQAEIQDKEMRGTF